MQLASGKHLVEIHYQFHEVLLHGSPFLFRQYIVMNIQPYDVKKQTNINIFIEILGQIF